MQWRSPPAQRTQRRRLLGQKHQWMAPPPIATIVARLPIRNPGTMSAALSTTALRAPVLAARRAVSVRCVAQPKKAQRTAAAKKEVALNSTLLPSASPLPPLAGSRRFAACDAVCPAMNACIHNHDARSAATPIAAHLPRRPLTAAPARRASALCLAAVVTLAGINPLASFLQGQADYFSTLDLPQPLVQWVSRRICPCSHPARTLVAAPWMTPGPLLLRPVNPPPCPLIH